MPVQSKRVVMAASLEGDGEANPEASLSDTVYRNVNVKRRGKNAVRAKSDALV